MSENKKSKGQRYTAVDSEGSSYVLYDEKNSEDLILQIILWEKMCDLMLNKPQYGVPTHYCIKDGRVYVWPLVYKIIFD